jgi:hypothetical protein
MEVKMQVQTKLQMLQQSCMVLYQVIPFFRQTTIIPVLTHVVTIPLLQHFYNRQLNVVSSKLNYDNGSKYGFTQNEIFQTICLFIIIITELLLESKQMNCNSVTSTTGGFICPSNNYFRYINLQHNMTYVKQVHL